MENIIFCAAFCETIRHLGLGVIQKSFNPKFLTIIILYPPERIRGLQNLILKRFALRTFLMIPYLKHQVFEYNLLSTIP